MVFTETVRVGRFPGKHPARNDSLRNMANVMSVNFVVNFPIRKGVIPKPCRRHENCGR